MGVCELIPGISGSTMALFLNLYERLIFSLNSYLPHNFYKIIKSKNRKKEIQKLEIPFLFFLILGILSAVFSFSHLLGFFIENYRNYIFSLFVGFIIISTFLQGRHSISIKTIKYSIVGLLFGISLIFLSPKNLIGSSSFEILIAGIISIIFGLLPGISGSFMLLILGKYEFILNSIRNFDFQIIFFFLIGIIIGTVLFVSIIKTLLDKHHKKLLSFFFAFVLGSIGVLILEILHNISQVSLPLVSLYFVLGLGLGFLLNFFMK